ncbi:MAG: hypothetical protein OXT09_24100 [Myxococcales bacterium]|nr:hypothetical protein [Myxococcales bacterium]
MAAGSSCLRCGVVSFETSSSRCRSIAPLASCDVCQSMMRGPAAGKSTWSR